MEPDDTALTPVERRYRRVAMAWIVIAVVVAIAAVVVFLYLSKTWPFHPSSGPKV